jgi:ClpP class serine protease
LSPHEPLSDDAISDLQKEVDRLYKMFVAMVARNRNISTAQVKATQAATYFGGDAIGLGLADQLEAGHNILKRISGMVSDTVIMKGNVMAENVESQISEAETYRAEILEISQLCKLAHAENKLAEFIEQGLNVDQVKEKLLASVSTQNEIVSTVYHKEVAQENPVVAAAKARMINK